MQGPILKYHLSGLNDLRSSPSVVFTLWIDAANESDWGMNKIPLFSNGNFKRIAYAHNWQKMFSICWTGICWDGSINSLNDPVGNCPYGFLYFFAGQY